MTRRALLPIVVVAGLVAAAPSTAGAAPARGADWASSANAICGKYGKEIDKIADPKTVEEAIASTQKVYGLASRQIDEVSKLSRPSKDKAAIGQLIADWRLQLGIVKDMIAAMKKNDGDKVEALIAKGDTINARVKATATKLRAKTCAD